MKNRKSIRSIRLGEAEVGMEVGYLNSLHLPPVSATVVEVGPVTKGSFQRYQEIRIRVHEFSRTDHETVMEGGCERVVIGTKGLK